MKKIKMLIEKHTLKFKKLKMKLSKKTLNFIP